MTLKVGDRVVWYGIKELEGFCIGGVICSFIDIWTVVLDVNGRQCPIVANIVKIANRHEERLIDSGNFYDNLPEGWLWY